MTETAQPPLPLDWPDAAERVRKQFERIEYGVFPRTSEITVEHTATDRPTHQLHQMAIAVTADRGKIAMDVLVFAPPSVHAAVIGLNFNGNHAVSADTAIWLPKGWMPSYSPGVVDSRATEAGRGQDNSAWPIEMAIQKGVAIATVYAGDIWPDDKATANQPNAFTDRSRPNSTGAFAAWAWGLQRAADAMQTIESLRGVPVFVWGHSRMGKAALVAAAFDEIGRFAGVISNQSGCGGAALFRNKQGERIANITANFPHWFAPAFVSYSGREDELPFDQHWLIALAAPRSLLVCSASDDTWADPAAERRALEAARPAWKQLDADPADAEYSIRPGKHSVLDSDWEVYLSFISRHLAKKSS